MLRRLLPFLAEGAPKPRPPLLQHRPFIKRDAERMRFTADGAFVLPKDNPGIRVEPDFVTEAEAIALTEELRQCIDDFGYSYDGDGRAHLVDSQSGSIEQTLPSVVNNQRVTGRLERPELQRLPPWKHGDEFDASALPPTMAALASRIATCGAFRVGLPRDATINAREHSFFQLDPHLDPASDGPDVFILTLESSVVLTFSPPDVPRRKDPHEIGMKSWTDRDIDVLALPRTLLHFTGHARTSWLHAIRAGVQVGDGDHAAICDWWGQPDYLVKRGPSRMSLVLAYGEPLLEPGGDERKGSS